MTIIRENHKIIYRADKNKKVKFVDDYRLYSEICVSDKNTRKVVEVDDAT